MHSQEKDPNTTPTKETAANSNRSWWKTWSRAQKHPTSCPLPNPPPTSGAKGDTGIGKVPKSVSTHRPPDDKTLEEELANLTSKITAIETLQQEMEVKIEEVANLKNEENTALAKVISNDLEDKIEQQVQISLTKTNANIKQLQASLTGAKSDIVSLDQKMDQKIKNLNIPSLISDLGETQDKVDDAQESLAGLETRMQTAEENITNQSTALVIGDDKHALTEAKSNIQNIEEHTVEERCKNCKSSPCLDGKPVTSENFTNGAHVTGTAASRKPLSGYTYIGANYTNRWFSW